MSIQQNTITNRIIKNYEKPTISSINNKKEKVTKNPIILQWIWLKIGTTNTLAKKENNINKMSLQTKLNENNLKSKENTKNTTFKEDLFNHSGQNEIIDPFNHG